MVLVQRFNVFQKFDFYFIHRCSTSNMQCYRGTGVLQFIILCIIVNVYANYYIRNRKKIFTEKIL